MAKKKTQLNDADLYALGFLNSFYSNSKKGFESLDVVADRKTIRKLLRLDYIFKTDKGYFISTIGIDYLANIK